MTELMTITEPLFIRTLNMSLTGSIVILAVLLIRLLFKKAPKIFSYCLWAAVLFRLLCPVSFTAAFSLFSMLQVPSASQGELAYFPQELIRIPQSSTQLNASGDNANTKTIAMQTAKTEQEKTAPSNWPLTTATLIWLLGMVILISYNLVNLIKLKQKLKIAAHGKDNIYTTPYITTPFVIGIFRPKIYLPQNLESHEKEYVLLHEQIHLKRKDHIIKLASFFALCLHWFNPFVWISFLLSEKDMEMSCDEAVIRKSGSHVIKEYSYSLLSMSTGAARKSSIGKIPLAFGEGNTGSRIRNILHYKKPTTIVVKSTALLCALAIIALLANPNIQAGAEKHNTLQNPTKTPVQTDRLDFHISNRFDLPDGAEKPGRDFYEIDIRSIAKSARTVDSFVSPMESPFEEEESLAFADNCQFWINYSMSGLDYRKVSFDRFAWFIENANHSLNKTCLLGFEDGKIVYAALENAWYRFGISSLLPVSYGYYEFDMESDIEKNFYKGYSLISSETADISERKGRETIEVCTDHGNDNSAVLVKDEAGELIFTQDASLSRAGWTNIYLGNINGTSFLLNVGIEDRWNSGCFSYQVFRLDQDGTPLLAASSAFSFTLSEGSSTIYDDQLFKSWIEPMENYLKNSHLLLSSQDGMIRTEKVSDAGKYNYQNLNLKERALEISTSEGGIINYHNSWYGKADLPQDTYEWLLWYNSLPESEQKAVNSIPPGLLVRSQITDNSTNDAVANP